MKKALLLSGITALVTAGSVLCAAEPPPPNEGQNPPACEKMQAFQDRGPQFGRRDGRQGCPMMRRGNEFGPGAAMGRQDAQRGMGPFAMRRGRHQFGGFGFMPRCPMNEDEMAKFFDLGQSLRDALENYRAENSEANTKALRSAVENLVTASQQYEIERCEKALARAKAAVAKKDQIVERQMKKLTRKPGPAEEQAGRKHGPRHPMSERTPEK